MRRVHLITLVTLLTPIISVIFITRIPLATGEQVEISDLNTVNESNLAPLVDEDNDGLPDSWEMEYFGSLKQTPTADSDNDDLTNEDEYFSGSDPTIPTPYIKEGALIQTAIDTAANGDLILVGPGVFPENIDFKGKVITLRAIKGSSETQLGQLTFSTYEPRETVVDGFTLRGMNYGAVKISSGSPTITNCVFIENSEWQGAIRIDGGAPLFSNCYFIENGVSLPGIGRSHTIVIRDSTGTSFVNCMFNKSKAGDIQALDSVVSIMNCTFKNRGTVLVNRRSTIDITNSIMKMEKATNDFSIPIDNDPGDQRNVNISYSNIQGCRAGGINGPNWWYVNVGMNGGGNIDQDPLFISDDDIHLQPKSPCIWKGTINGAPQYDIDGDPRLRPENVDMGADEVDPEQEGETPVIMYFIAYPTSRYKCLGTELQWSVRYGESIRIEPGVGSDLPLSGTIQVYPETTTTYTLHAQNGNLSAEKEVTFQPIGFEDSDNDEIIDGEESCSCTDKDNPDTDGDGLLDGVEDANHNGKKDPGETDGCNPDTDGDGMPDGWEVSNDLDPHKDDSQEDPDGDGYPNIIEYKGDTDPQSDKSYPNLVRYTYTPNGSLESSSRTHSGMNN